MLNNLYKIPGVLLGFTQLAFCDFHPSYDPKDWPKYVIKFSSDGTLKDVFDAGLRPYCFPSLETSALGFKHVHVSFELNSGEVTSQIPVEWGDISPLTDGLLSDIEITSPNLSIQEAESLMVPFLKNGTKPIEKLRKFLELAKADPRNYDDPYQGDPSKFAISWSEINGPKYVVFFKPTFDPNKPVSIAMNARWTISHRTSLQLSSFYNIPIPPPPGYENISMDAPPNFGPDSAVEIARSKGLPITGDRTSEEYEKQWREANDKTRAPKSKTHPTAPTPNFTASPKTWVWSIVIFSLATAVWLVRRWKLKTTR